MVTAPMYASPMTRITGAPGGGGIEAGPFLLRFIVNAPMMASPSHSTSICGGTMISIPPQMVSVSITETPGSTTAWRRSSVAPPKIATTRMCRGTSHRPFFSLPLKMDTSPLMGVFSVSSLLLTRSSRYSRCPEQTSEEPHDPLHVAADVVEHDRDKKRGDDHQSALQNPLARLHAERASLDCLGDVENDLAAVENWNRQQVEHRDVDANERDQREQILNPASRRLHRDLRDRDRASQLRHSNAARKQGSESLEDCRAPVDRDTPRFAERAAEADRYESFFRDHADAPNLALDAGTRIRAHLGRRRHDDLHRLPRTNNSKTEWNTGRRADSVEQHLPARERNAVQRCNAVAGLDPCQRRWLPGRDRGRDRHWRRDTRAHDQSSVDHVREHRVHEDAGQHDEQPLHERLRLEPPRLGNRLGSERNHRIGIESVFSDIAGLNSRVLAATLEESGCLVFARRHPHVPAQRKCRQDVFSLTVPLLEQRRSKPD